jgi:hypothetical protein
MNKDHNINDEENEGGKPSFGDQHPFRTGNDYFERFSSRLNERIEGLDEIRAIAPVLYSLPKYNPFEVPDDYFEELPSRVSERALSSKNTLSLYGWLILLIRPRFVIPVAATLLLAFAGINYMNSLPDVPKTATEEFSLEEHLYDIDESTIIDKLTAEAVTDENSEENGIRDYLIDNNIDETNLEL